jgi:hypothetical protein
VATTQFHDLPPFDGFLKKANHTPLHSTPFKEQKQYPAATVEKEKSRRAGRFPGFGFSIFAVQL